MPLPKLLSREQAAFLRRPRRGWEAHLGQVRAFLGEGLATADPGRPVLVLGAGSGLEVPWGRLRGPAVGWDADPWSRLRTFLRHHRWLPWIFEDLTGSFGPLQALLERTLRPTGLPHSRLDTARCRLAGLIPGLPVQPNGLACHLERLRPGTVLVANVLGQLGVMAELLVASAFKPHSPWESDPERPDPLAEAVDRWTSRVLVSVLGQLGASGADLWMVHDRMVFHGEVAPVLGPSAPHWRDQLEGGTWEASDPWVNLDPRQLLGGAPLRCERWVWSLAPNQHHLMEGLRFGPGSPGPCSVQPGCGVPV